MANLVVPKGLLLSRNPFEAGLDIKSASRPIDHVQRRADEQLRRARGTSMDLGALGRTRETGQQFPHANSMPIAARYPAARESEDSVDPLHTPAPTTRTRGHTISTPYSAAVSENSSSSSSFTSSSPDSWSPKLKAQGWDSPRLPSWGSPKLGPQRKATRDESGLFLTHDLGRYAFPKKEEANFEPIRAAKVEARDFADQGDAIEPLTLRRTKTHRTHRTRASSTGLRNRLSVAISRTARRTSLYDLYEKAKYKQERIRRSPLVQRIFEYSIYVLIVAFIYLVVVGLPLWKGAVYWLYWVVDHKFVISGGFAITVGLAAIYAFAPLLIFFDKDPPVIPENDGGPIPGPPGPTGIALLIPCYKSGKIIGATLEAALKIFPKENIFVVANGNSPTPLGDTGDVCARYGVSHTWSPLGSKIIAQFVGCYVAPFPHILLIDDDCLLPPTFPLSTARFSKTIKCIGYTITSTGPRSTLGTLVQQAQDLEYKLSGLQRQFAGLVGSATFPHGAISMWDRSFLLKTFYEHPGFSVSEDWFFGHVARTLGSRIVMNSEVFVETETPAAIFWAGRGGERGGFGEMTVWRQRFERWNFFFVNGLYWNLRYIFCSWRLGWWEVGAKIFVFQEVYETLLYLLTPFILPISFIVRPSFCGYLLAGTLFLYFANTLIFNLVHLRRKRRVINIPSKTSPTSFETITTTHALSTKALLFYLPYKFLLTAVNVASCYWSIFKYARYFARRHPKVVEDDKVVEVVLNLDTNKRNGVDKEKRGFVEEEDNVLTLTAVVTRGAEESGDMV